MTAFTALVRDNPGLLAMLVLLAIGTIVVGSLAIALWRSGASLRPIIFVGGLLTLVWLPQFAYHLGVASGAIPRRNLTWIPSADRASVYGWAEREAALVVRDGAFADLAAVFGPGVDVTLGSDLRATGGNGGGPFAGAEAVYMAVLPEGSAIVARFSSSAAAERAAREYARQAVGLWPAIGSDGLRTASRPAGDIVKVALAGRTFVVLSGASEGSIAKRFQTFGAIVPASARSDPGSENYWLFRPGVLPASIVVLIALYVFAFFKGATWAGSVPAATDAHPATAMELRHRLLALDSVKLPLTITEEGDGRLVATWRFADARWLDLARACKLRYVARVVMDLDPDDSTVRVTEQMTRFDASAGVGGVSLEWQTLRGVTFFQVERGRVFGVQFDANGRPEPALNYAWRFDSREMKAPLIDLVTRAGWEWRPTPWSGPASLRWLTG